MNTVSPIDLQHSIPVYHTVRHDIWLSTTEPRSFVAFKKGSLEAVSITRVVSDIPYRTVPILQLTNVLPLTYSQLKELGDGSHKLSIHRRLPGGMPIMSDEQKGAMQLIKIDDSKAEDEVIEKHLHDHLTNNEVTIYSSIKVETVYHHFRGLPEGEPTSHLSRTITLQPSTWGAFKNVVRLLFINDASLIRQTAVAGAVLGREDCIPALKDAARFNYAIEITFSKDLKYIDVTLTPGKHAGRAHALRASCVVQ